MWPCIEKLHMSFHLYTSHTFMKKYSATKHAYFKVRFLHKCSICDNIYNIYFQFEFPIIGCVLSNTFWNFIEQYTFQILYIFPANIIENSI